MKQLFLSLAILFYVNASCQTLLNAPSDGSIIFTKGTVTTGYLSFRNDTVWNIIVGKIWLCTCTYVKGKTRYCNATVVRAETEERAIVIYKRALNSWKQYHKSKIEVPINVSEIKDENIYTEETVFIKP